MKKKNTENVTLTTRRRQKSHGNLTFKKELDIPVLSSSFNHSLGV